ncbi:MAG: c-type cytochrome domain-containing protein [Verrucomicrobiota bacterium]
MPDFLIPFGPLHIVLLHIPIGVLIAICCLELLLRDKGQKNPAVSLLHLLLIGSTALTIVLGLALKDLGNYGEELEAHELWGFIFGGCVVLTYVLHWLARFKQTPKFKRIYIGGLALSVLSMTITGHYGGELVHGKGFLTRSFKDNSREESPPSDKTATETPPAEGALSNQSSASANEDLQVFLAAQAAMDRHCYECHGPNKQKGDYRMDLKNAIFTAGKSDLSPVVPGDLEASELIYRILLPENDDEIMPPEKKGRMPEADIQAIVDWVKSGAVWPDSAAPIAKPSAEPERIGNQETDAIIEQINRTGAKAEYNAWGDHTVRVDLGVVESTQLEAALIATARLGERLSWLDCSQLELPQSFFQQLPRYQNLQRLHLDASSVTDQDLKTISQLPELSYLNLYKTQISDTAIESLKQSPSLQTIYLSETNVTRKGLKVLQTALPKLEVIHR